MGPNIFEVVESLKDEIKEESDEDEELVGN